MNNLTSVLLIAPGFNLSNARTHSQAMSLGPKLKTFQSLSESSSRLKTQHKMYKNNWTIITDCIGPKICQHAQTKRIWMKRRQEMHNAPIVIVCLDGVLANTM